MQLSDAEVEKLRQSGIRLDREGHFWHEGERIAHAGLVAALWRWLDQNPDGRYVLRLDERRFVYLDVDDAPYLVTSLRWQGASAIVHLSDGSEEPLALDSLHLRDGVAYARVKGGRFPARLASRAWAVLTERLEERDGNYYLGEVRLQPTGNDSDNSENENGR